MAVTRHTLSEGQVSALHSALATSLAGEVRFDAGSRALYATDGSNYRQVPIGVVVPRTIEDVIATLRICADHDAPILSRGGGTSLAGQCCNEAVVIDFSKYLNMIEHIDSARRLAWVQPGCVLDHLRDEAECFNLTFGPDPATHDHNTLGGMIGNNSCGVHSVMAGRTADNVEELDILTYDGLRLRVGATSEEDVDRIIAEGGRRGEIYAGLKRLRDRYADQIRARFPAIPRRVSGFNLPQLLPENGFNVARALVGTEGTCVTVLGAGLKLVHSPPFRVLLVMGFPDIYRAGDVVPRILEHRPVGLEGVDNLLIDYMKIKHLHPDDVDLLPDGGGWLLVEFGGDTRGDAVEQAKGLMAAMGDDEPPAMRLLEDPQKQSRIWDIREAGLAATAHIPGQPDTWPGWEDAAVAPDHVGAYLREFRALLDRYGYGCSLYGHFGDGCIHVRIDFDLVTRDGITKYRRFVDEAAELVLKHNGSFSGEHGDGQSRGELLSKMFGDELVDAFREFKEIWDPRWRMNPGKVIDPDPITANLRLGADYAPPKLDTVFAYPEDNGDFRKVSIRCVGVGKCRRESGGVMCPSYMATREEKDSTRGRARMLFEMMQGKPLTDLWKSDAVHDALDLCLACKGCKSDCPVHVDMATYKAEFNHHYYKGRLRPRAAYSMGLIHWWSRAASRAPRLANWFARTQPFERIAKSVGGIAPERRLPAFAECTFVETFRRRLAPGGGPRRTVMLWPDTFNNHFTPEVALAAVDVLERAGYTVTIPSRPLCCGRPLFAWGMLDLAKRQLGDILSTFGDELGEGVPVVGLEPACVAAFRDELPNLFANDPRAEALSRRTMMLGEFLEHEGVELPTLEKNAVVHAHCNQHAIMGMEGDEKVLRRLGLDYRLLNSGCCGMAGSFGFEAEHYEVSRRAAERVLLPAVRAAADETLVITNGYSCREQISQGTGRRALHLAEVLAMAFNDALHGNADDRR